VANFNPWTNKNLQLCNSYQRTEVLFYEMVREPDDRNRMSLFLTHWCDCDAPWEWRSYFAGQLRQTLTRVSLADCLEHDELDWFNSLPAEIEIYRGCQRGRERGLSWTTDLNVAEGFARGKRCINSAPTLMSATIPKQHLFGVFAGRSESEIAVDLRRLRRLHRMI
jgi:hypothetical protein